MGKNTLNLTEVLAKKEFEGVSFSWQDGTQIKPGDSYLAERNTGVKLLTCKQHNRNYGYLISEENAYPYDTRECVKVIFNL